MEVGKRGSEKTRGQCIQKEYTELIQSEVYLGPESVYDKYNCLHCKKEEDRSMRIRETSIRKVLEC